MDYDMPKEYPDFEAPAILDSCARRGLVPLLTSTALREDGIADSPDFRRHSLFETFQHRYLIPLGPLGDVETSRARAVCLCECNNIGICPVREQSPDHGQSVFVPVAKNHKSQERDTARSGNMGIRADLKQIFKDIGFGPVHSEKY